MLISVSPSAFRASSSARHLRLVALMIGFAALAFCVMWWRWGGTVEDSQAYFDTARFLRCEIGLGELRARFPYRLLVPALAAAMPGDLRNAFAALNWMLVSGAACFMLLTVKRLGFGSRRAVAYRALTDWRSIASRLGGAGLVLPLALVGLRLAPARLASLKSLLLLMALPPLYAALCVRIDGRAIWNLYPMLILVAVTIGMARMPHPNTVAQGGA